MGSSAIMGRNNVNVIGSGSETLVMAHGFGSDQTAWRQQVAALQDHYRIVLYDNVGGGKSDINAYNPNRYSTLHGYAEDLLEILDELKLRQVTMVGHSVSGMVSLLAALVEPARFKRLIFVGASPRYLNDTNYVGGFNQNDLVALFQAMSANYHAWAAGFGAAVMGNPQRPELAHEFASTLGQLRPDIAQQVARVIFQSDHRADLPKLRVPVVILQAQQDLAVPVAVGEYLQRHLANSQLHLLDATGHFPHLSAPDQVNRIIQNSLLS